jgi:hypothetical protein
MIKIQISGDNKLGLEIVRKVTARALRDVGIDVSTWSDVSRGEVAKCVRATKSEEKSVVILEMNGK